MITLLYITQTLMSRYNYNIDYINGNRSKCVIVKLPHQTTKGEISLYEYYNTRYEV